MTKKSHAQPKALHVRSSARKAVAVDPAAKTAVAARLKRAEGQLRGIQRMVLDERSCADVMTQISAVQEALRAASRELLRNHLSHCVASAVRAGKEGPAIDELVDLLHKGWR